MAKEGCLIFGVNARSMVAFGQVAFDLKALKIINSDKWLVLYCNYQLNKDLLPMLLIYSLTLQLHLAHVFTDSLV